MDSLAHRVVERARGARPAIIEGKDLDAVWAEAVAEAGLLPASNAPRLRLEPLPVRLPRLLPGRR